MGVKMTSSYSASVILSLGVNLCEPKIKLIKAVEKANADINTIDKATTFIALLLRALEPNSFSLISDI